MWSPFFGILLRLNFELVGNPFTLEFPIVLTDSTDNNLLILINGCIGSTIFPVVHFLFFAHFDFIHHFITIVNFLFSIIRLFLLHIFNFLILGSFETEIFALQGLSCQLIQNCNYLLSTTWFELQWRKFTLNTQLFALVNYCGRNCHWIIEFGKITWRYVI